MITLVLYSDIVQFDIFDNLFFFSSWDMLVKHLDNNLLIIICLSAKFHFVEVAAT